MKTPTPAVPADPPRAARGRDGETASISVPGTLNGTPSTWALPEEVPVAIHLNSASYAVMMATPVDLEDFAIGFALSEGLVESPRDIANVLAFPAGDGFTADIAVKDGKLIRQRMVSRTLEGRAGCGLCGIRDMEDALRMPEARVTPVTLTPSAVARAFAELPRFQPMNAVNHTVHAAAWASPDGAIQFSREDVGRHNALDKLIGAMARRGTAPLEGFAVLSSRCSFELVQKCATVGIGALATISAPTALAWKLAQDAGLNLAALSKQGVMIFDGEN